MSLRYIPYGYKFEDGQPIPHSDESQVVREIFTRYCAGESLKAIAEGLTQRQVEYTPGKTDWNKARIKRILENSRYAGEGDYKPCGFCRCGGTRENARWQNHL